MGSPVVFFEIGSASGEKTGDFFARLFDWVVTQHGPATMINTGSERGIQGHITSLGHEPHNYVTVYVEVDDVKKYLDKAVSLGGKILVPPVDIPTGTFAWLGDLDGNVIGLWKSKE